MTDILNLPFYQAGNVNENDIDYLIEARTTVPPKACPACKALVIVKHGAREAVFMDIPIHGKRVGINLIRQRYRCRSADDTSGA